MANEVVFLCPTQGKSAHGGDLESLCRMKAFDAGTAQPFVAFGSESLGLQFIAGLNAKDQFTLKPLSSLSPECAALARSEKTIFFQDQNQVASYLQNAVGFDFHRHVISLQEAEQKVRSLAL